MIIKGYLTLNFVLNVLSASWHLLVDSSVYIVFGLIVAGLLRVFLNPGMVAKHLGRGRFASVLKASILGIPIPL
jgi:uncharacterized membrane protein YraQ (UPF0718 family)